MTLAHELGHGVHAALAARQGIFHQGTPLTLAETASVFGEALTFARLLEASPTPAARLALLAEDIEGAIATVFRQVAMNGFEELVHTERREQGELSVERFGELWAQTQTELLGDAVEVTDGYRSWWSYIPHFISTPGYVYAYAYGQLLALSVYERYLVEGAGFEQRYLELLARRRLAQPRGARRDRRHRPERSRVLGARPRPRRAPPAGRRGGRTGPVAPPALTPSAADTRSAVPALRPRGRAGGRTGLSYHWSVVARFGRVLSSLIALMAATAAVAAAATLVNGSSGPLKATLAPGTHTPKINPKWPIKVTATLERQARTRHRRL